MAAEGNEGVARPSPSRTFRMALTGDSIITRKLSVYREPQYMHMIELLRDADMAFTNLEVLFHDYETYAAHQSGGTWMRADPALAKELVWAGFKMVSRANNHTGDYGVEGMRLTTRHVENVGLVHAGCGESLPDAREARYLETPRGRVALVSVASTFPAHSRAGRSRSDIPARPGLSPLRHTKTRVLEPEHLERLQSALHEIGLVRTRQKRKRLKVFGTTLVAGDRSGTRTAPNNEDLEEIGAVVRSAGGLADYTVVSLHAHNRGDGGRFTPAEFLVTFARRMIDLGADVVVGHGPHVLRGIEMYKSKPILYSLGNFILQTETVLRQPDESDAKPSLRADPHVGEDLDARSGRGQRGYLARSESWETAIAILDWRDAALKGLRLHPVTLGFGQPRSQRGRPMLAEGELAEKILGDLRRLSKPFGTEIEITDGVGILALG